MSIHISEGNEARLTREAQRQGLSVDALIERLMNERSAPAHAMSYERPPGRKSLVDLFEDSPWNGLDLDFSRNTTPSRPIDLSWAMVFCSIPTSRLSCAASSPIACHRLAASRQ